MPLIVDEADWATWLESSAKEAKHLVRPNPMPGFVRYPVGALVNSVKNDGPELLARAETPAERPARLL